MTYSLEKGVPIPPAYNAKSKFLLTLREMKVGDSFLVPDKSEHTRAKAATSNYKGREGKGKEFTSRKSNEGLRIWRTK